MENGELEKSFAQVLGTKMAANNSKSTLEPVIQPASPNQPTSKCVKTTIPILPGMHDLAREVPELPLLEPEGSPALSKTAKKKKVYEVVTAAI